MMVCLRQKGQELGKQFSADENAAHVIAGTTPDYLLRSQALYASAMDI
jgi:hypothetical protein